MTRLGVPVRPRTPWTRRLLAAAPLALLALLCLPCRAARAGGLTSTRWPDEVIELAATLPLQEGGRVMPLSTLADYTLLQWNARKGGKDADDASISPIEVVFDAIFRPSVAAHYSIFVVDDDQVLDAIGLEHAGKQRRDRYSFADLAPARDELFERADALRAAEREARKSGRTVSRNTVENGILELATKIERFESFASLLRVLLPIPLDDAPALKRFFPGAETVEWTELAGKSPEMLRAVGDGGEDSEALGSSLRQVFMLVKAARDFRTVPPTGSKSDDADWKSTGDLVHAALTGGSIAPEHQEILASYRRCLEAARSPSSSAAAFRELHDRVTKLARARDEYDNVLLEVSLARLDPFGRSLVGYLVAFVLAALSWLSRKRPLVTLAWIVLLVTLALHVAGIVIRCILRGRPPISNLYDTTVFISAFAVALAAVIERIDRHRIALAVGPFLGAVVLFLSKSYERTNAGDTMPQLVAVLDTNFWLAVHVTCISIGYSASLLSAFFGMTFVLARIAGARSGAALLHTLGRIAYGVLCFGLFFSIVGTILGGIWANESWGRFWGWDPKENGALMIVLVQLATLHGRMAGFLRLLGVSVATMLCGLVVGFSWWGVNAMGIGLHSYAGELTSGIWTGLEIAAGWCALLFVALGVRLWIESKTAAASV